MGIKVKVLVAVGTGLAAVVATILGIRKKEDERYEKIQEMIRDVDQKKEEPKQVEEPKTVEEMTVDVIEAISGMDIDGDDTETDWKKKVLQNVQVGDNENAQQWLDRNFEVIEGKREKAQKTAEEIAKDVDDLMDQQDIWEKRAKEKERRIAEGDWLRDVEEAKKAKSFGRLVNLFNEKYNPYPCHPAPSSVYAEALREGVIDQKLYDSAAKYYGRLWNYSGD